MAAQELTTLAAVKEYLGITEDTDDALLGRLIAAASAFLLGEMRRERMDTEYKYVRSYAEVPADVAQACVELVALRYKEKDRIGEQSKNVAGQYVMFSLKDMSPFTESIVRRYKRVTPE